jgi:hypothetical protein
VRSEAESAIVFVATVIKFCFARLCAMKEEIRRIKHSQTVCFVGLSHVKVSSCFSDSM